MCEIYISASYFYQVSAMLIYQSMELKYFHYKYKLKSTINAWSMQYLQKKWYTFPYTNLFFIWFFFAINILHTNIWKTQKLFKQMVPTKYNLFEILKNKWQYYQHSLTNKLRESNSKISMLKKFILTRFKISNCQRSNVFQQKSI